MIRYLLLSMLLALSLTSFSQETELMTSDENISFINKKVAEANGSTDPAYSDGSHSITRCSLTKKGKNLVYVFSSTDADGDRAIQTQVFDPMFIKEVDHINGSKNKLGTINIFVNDGTQRANCRMLFLNGTDNFKSIKKALLKLQELYSAKFVSEVFGNKGQ